MTTPPRGRPRVPIGSSRPGPSQAVVRQMSCQDALFGRANEHRAGSVRTVTPCATWTDTTPLDLIEVRAGRAALRAEDSRATERDQMHDSSPRWSRRRLFGVGAAGLTG